MQSLKRDPTTGSLIPERQLSKMSSNLHYFEEKKGLKKDDLHGKMGGGMKSGMGELPRDLRELLYSGVSDEYEGRYAYLKVGSSLESFPLKH